MNHNRHAIDIAQRIADLNSQHSAKHGDDLFKATSKTAHAQIAIGAPVKNYDEYKDLIEHVYFLFHEGVGNRLDGRTPQSFTDVNTLRTELQHDVDHGAPSKVRAKKRKAGTAFEKYSGVRSPLSDLRSEAIRSQELINEKYGSTDALHPLQTLLRRTDVKASMKPRATSIIRFGLWIAAARISVLLLLVWLGQTGRQTISELPLVFLLYPEGLLLPFRAGAGAALQVLILSVLLVMGSFAAGALVYLFAKQLSR